MLQSVETGILNSKSVYLPLEQSQCILPPIAQECVYPVLVNRSPGRNGVATGYQIIL